MNHGTEDSRLVRDRAVSPNLSETQLAQQAKGDELLRTRLDLDDKQANQMINMSTSGPGVPG